MENNNVVTHLKLPTVTVSEMIQKHYPEYYNTKGLSMCSTDAISNFLGLHVDALVGNDILKHFNVLVDYA